MSWLQSPGLFLLQRFMDVDAMRQTLVSTNIANVDTPGYHARDVDFKGELARALNEGTQFGSPQEDGMSPFVQPVRGLLARPDGNNVSVEREGLLLGEVQLQFKTAAAILRSEFAEIHTAIREGQ